MCEDNSRNLAHKSQVKMMALAMSPKLSSVSKEVVTIDDQVKASKYLDDSITFDYKLNDKAAKAKLVKSAKRVPLEIEENSCSSNLIFSAGAWQSAVLTAIRYWNDIKDGQPCKAGESIVKIRGMKSGKDTTGKNVVSQVVFLVDGSKIVCHFYNTTLLILVNGHGYQRFIDIFLKPFFQAKVNACPEEIQSLNQEVIEKCSKTVKRSTVKYKGGSSFPCNQCDHACKNLSALKKHKISDHSLSVNASQNLKNPRHSTRNNSLANSMMIQDVSITKLDKKNTKQNKTVPRIINEDISLLDVTNDTITLEENTEANPEESDKKDNIEPVKVEDFFNCKQCDFVAETENNLKTHIETTHKKNVCSSNTFVLEDAKEEELLTAIITEEEKGLRDSIVICSVCSQSFESEEECTNHIFTHSDIIVFQCEKCECSYKTNLDLEWHQETEHEVASISHLKCPACAFNGSDQEDLEQHKRRVHVFSCERDIETEQFNCHLCDLKMSDLSTMDKHYTEKHGILNCEKCNFSAEDLVVMKTHMAKHTGSIIFTCEICEFESTRKILLENHMKTKHSRNLNIQEASHKCNQCGKQYKHLFQLQYHICAPMKKYNCKECNFESNNESDLLSHIKASHTHIPALCSYCNFVAKNENALKLHVITEHEDSAIITIIGNQQLMLCEAMGIFKQDIETTLNAIVQGQNYLKSELLLLKEEFLQTKNTCCNIKHESNDDNKEKKEKDEEAKKKEYKTTEKKDKTKKSSGDKSNSIPSDTPNFTSKPTVSSSKSVPPSSSSKPANTTSSTSMRKNRKSLFNSCPKLLYVGDSVGYTASMRAVERFSNSRMRTATAYSSVHDSQAKWPKFNFTAVVENALKNPGKDDFEVLVLSAPTVDITNMDTSKLISTDSIDYYQQKTIISSQNMFSLAQRSLQQNPNLKKVVLIEHPPRFVKSELDPTALKPDLARLANATLSQLWMNSPIKDNIFLGHHSLECSGTGDTQLAKYKNQSTGRYNCVHFYGPNGCRDYTNSVKTILMLALSGQNFNTTATKGGPAQSNNHSNCPQAKFQTQQSYHPSVQPRNRFGVFISNLGNF